MLEGSFDWRRIAEVRNTFFGAISYLCKIGMAGLRDSYLMFLMPFAPSICFKRVFYI